MANIKILKEYYANKKSALELIERYEKGECSLIDLEFDLSAFFGIPQVKLDEVNGIEKPKRKRKK